MALDREQFDAMACGTPGCDHTAHDGLYLHANCHRESPTWVEYQAKTGNLRVTCGVCGRLVAEVAVKG